MKPVHRLNYIGFTYTLISFCHGPGTHQRRRLNINVADLLRAHPANVNKFLQKSMDLGADPMKERPSIIPPDYRPPCRGGIDKSATQPAVTSSAT
jgi:hypothetical protein